MLTEMRRPIYEQSENFSKEKILKTIKVNKTDEYINWTEKFNEEV